MENIYEELSKSIHFEFVVNLALADNLYQRISSLDK